MSYRRLWLLIKHLPAESWTQTALRDADLEDLEELTAPEPSPDSKFGPWSLSNYQLAQLIDAVRDVAYVSGVVGQVTPQPKPPQPTPRPGLRSAKATRPRDELAEAQVLYLNQLRARG